MNDAQFGRFGSGKPVRRVEDADLLAGKGRFADDASVPNQVYAYFLRSPHAHARIASIDGRAAKEMPGVIAVVTGDDLVRAGVKPLPSSADFKRPDGKPLASPPRHALAVDAVRFVGEAVAVARKGRLDPRYLDDVGADPVDHLSGPCPLRLHTARPGAPPP